MAKRKIKPPAGGFVLFDVVYEDGTRTSNRKVPEHLVGGLDGEEAARIAIEQQDREIAARGGTPRGPIKSMTRTPA